MIDVRAWFGEARWRPWQGLAALASEILILAVAAGLLIPIADARLPPQDLPWKPLRIDDPVGLFTRTKLLTMEGPHCRALLAQGGVRTTDAAEQASGFCRIHDAVRIVSGVPLRPAGTVMTCREALAVAIWDRQVVRPVARGAFKSEVAAIDHYGSYSCRRQYGARTGRISEHAYANALDVAGFQLSDGRRVSVARDWKLGDDKAGFLHDVRGGACRLFNVTLSPDFNAAHHDHLHLDMGGFHTCR